MFIRAVLLLLAGSLLFADELTMKNGDRLSGAIVKFDGKAITLKSDYAGTLTITWDAVTAITSTQPLNVSFQGGQSMVGTITTADGKLTVETAASGPVSAPRASLLYIRNNAEEASHAVEVDPRLIDLWTGNLALGYSKTQGNSKTTNINLNGTAARVTATDKTSAYINSLFASDATSGTRVTTANSQRGGLQYDRNLSPKLYAFGGADFESDQFQSLDLRFVPGGGFGYHAIKTSKTIFDVSAGVTLDREYYVNNVNHSYAEAQATEEFTYRFTKVTTLHQKNVIFPNLSSTGDLRNNFDISADTKLRKWLAWQVAISDRYISNPLPGRLRNDLIITTGVNLTLSK